LDTKRATTRLRYIGAALGCCLGLSPAVQAQAVVSPVTTGSEIPENAPIAAIPTQSPTRTQTVNFGVTVGMGETDNVFATAAQARTQTVALAGIDFGWIRTGSMLDANVVGNFNYLDYVQGAYASELLSRFDGTTSLSLFGDHLKWFLQDDFGDGQLNPYTPATPTNLEDVNYLSTGPEVTLRPISDTVVQFGARYGLVTYQTSPFNGSRTSENVLFERLLSPNSDVGLGADAEQLRFDNQIVNSDYDRGRYYVRYDITGARTQIMAAVGETQNNDGGTWETTPLVQFSLTHELTQQTSFNVTGGREFTDAADAFGDIRSGAAGGIAVAPVAQTSEDYLRTYATAGLQLTGRRTTIGATAYWERDTYAIDDIFNVTRANLELSAGRQLSNVLNASIFGLITQSKYLTQGVDINTNAVGGDVTWQAGRTFSVAGRYVHNFQGASAQGLGYSSNTVFVTVTYRPVLSGVLQQRQLQQEQQQQQQQ
jgi:hypothetical protein